MIISVPFINLSNSPSQPITNWIRCAHLQNKKNPSTCLSICFANSLVGAII